VSGTKARCACLFLGTIADYLCFIDCYCIMQCEAYWEEHTLVHFRASKRKGALQMKWRLSTQHAGTSHGWVISHWPACLPAVQVFLAYSEICRRKAKDAAGS
jgi:hypothetical protein